MRTVREIYEAYRIMPNLQLHQLRVTAVAKQVCEHFKEPIDTHTVILAALFHDMGNIIKFDFSVFPEFLEPKGREYWQGVKDEYVKKYSADHHAANLAIAKEIGLSEKVQMCIDSVAISKIEDTLANGSWEQKICEYADTRVGPHGVLPLKERFLEGRRRYLMYHGAQDEPGIAAPQDKFDVLLQTEKEMEKRILDKTSLTPGDITDESIAPSIEELRNYSVA